MLRILLADDCPTMRSSVRKLLEREGFEVVAEAGNGFEAIDAAGKWRPDVAVLDLSMPGLDGIDGARGIAFTCPQTRVVLLTGHAQEYQIVRALQAGITAYVVKAEAAEHLANAVREVAQGRVFLSPAPRRVAADYVVEKNGLLSLRA